MFKGFFTDLFHSSVFQQWLHARFCATEIFVESHRVFAVTLLQHVPTEQFGGVFVEDSMLFESFKGVVIQYVSPQVTVIAGCISADDVIELSQTVTWGNFRDKIELVHSFFFVRNNI